MFFLVSSSADLESINVAFPLPANPFPQSNLLSDSPLTYLFHFPDNGFGGKIEPNETSLAGAIRELHEESHLLASPESTIYAGALLLRTTADLTAPDLWIHVYICTEWSGQELETDEMRPEWFNVEELPLSQMWEETVSWMPGLLKRWVDGGRASVGHCVSFEGGNDPGTGEWSVWHGMTGGSIRWWDGENSQEEWELLVNEWEEEGKGDRVPN